MGPLRLCAIAVSQIVFILPAQQVTSLSRPTLTYERMFGGSESDAPTSVTTDLQGNVIVAGTTDSVDFPTTPGSYKPSFPGPLQIRRNSSQSFQSVRVGSAAKVNKIAFSADGLIGYADTSSTSGANAVIYRTVDGGSTWQPVASRLPDTVSLLVIDPATPFTVYAATPPDLYKSTDGGDTWSKVAYPAKNNFPPSFLTVDPADSNRLFLIIGFQPSQVLRTVDGGKTWQQLSTGFPYDAGKIAIDPNQPNIVYSAGSFNNIFRSMDGGDSWKQLLPGVTPIFIRAQLVVDSSSILYAATDKGIYKSTDQGESYSLTPTPDGLPLTSFQIDPQNASHFLVSTSFQTPSSLFESYDAGATWRALDPIYNPGNNFLIRGSSLFAPAPPTRQIFVTKWNSLTGTILWSTYVGTTGYFSTPKAAVDRNGFIYVTGGAGYVYKLSPDGAQLVWFTMLSPEVSGVSDMKVDDAGSVYVVGTSCSPDFSRRSISTAPLPPAPTLPYSLVCNLNPGGAFVVKLNPAGTSLAYSVFLDGTETGLALALDASGRAYVAGQAAYRTGQSFQGTSPLGPSYIAKISPAGDKVESALLLNANASAAAIALAPSGEVLVTGASERSLLPDFFGAFQALPVLTGCSFGSTNAYVLRTSPDLVPNAFSFLGSGCDGGSAIRADRSGNIWISGYTGSPRFPQRAGYQSAGRGFVAEFTPNANDLLFCSYVDFVPYLTISRENSVFLASGTGRFGPVKKVFISSSSGGAGLLTRIDP